MFLENLFSLNNKVALVTGGRSGIGRVLALGLAQAGADVVVTCRTVEGAEKVAEEIRGIGRRSLALWHDVRRPMSSREVMEATVREFGHIDILVNNAGVIITEPAIEVSEDNWDAVVEVNLKGLFFCCQAAAKYMIAQRKGRIINIASVLGLVGMGNRASYAASKAGVINLTRELACEWAQYNINVNAIAPGSIRTPLSQRLHADKEYLEKLLSRLVIKRVGDPEEVVGAAIFLASSASDLVTGHTLVVDAGWSIW